MGILSGIFKSRDKPQNATSGSAYRFFIGGSCSGENLGYRRLCRESVLWNHYSCIEMVLEHHSVGNSIPLEYHIPSDG